VGHPFDTIKVRVQAQQGGAALFSNSNDCLRYTLATEGIRGLYKGVTAPLSTVVFVNSIFFAINGQMKRLMASFNNTNNNSNSATITYNNDDHLPMSHICISGAATGLVASAIVTPRDLLKSLLQLQYNNRSMSLPSAHPHFNGTIDCAKHIIKNHGFRALFRGLNITILRDVPGDAAYFGAYELAKRALAAQQNTTTDKLNILSLMFAGGCGGAAYWGLIFPFDSIKTRLQTMPFKLPNNNNNNIINLPNNNKFTIYNGIVDCAIRMYKTEGVKSFYRGFGPSVLRAFPTSGINFVLFEFVLRAMKKQTSSHVIPVEQ